MLHCEHDHCSCQSLSSTLPRTILLLLATISPLVSSSSKGNPVQGSIYLQGPCNQYIIVSISCGHVVVQPLNHSNHSKDVRILLFLCWESLASTQLGKWEQHDFGFWRRLRFYLKFHMDKNIEEQELESSRVVFSQLIINITSPAGLLLLPPHLISSGHVQED